MYPPHSPNPTTCHRPAKKQKKQRNLRNVQKLQTPLVFFCFISVAAIVKGEIGFFFFFNVRECVVAQAGLRRMCREENVADCLVKARRARLCN